VQWAYQPLQDMQGDLRERVKIWEVTVLVTVTKRRVHTNMCLFLNGDWDEAVWITRPNPVTSKVYTRKVDTPDELLARSHFGCYCQHKET